MPDPPSATPPARHPGGHEIARRRRFWWRALWVCLAAVIIPPLIGLVGAVVGMTRSFSTLSESGQADPEALASDVSISLLTTVWGLAISVANKRTHPQTKGHTRRRMRRRSSSASLAPGIRTCCAWPGRVSREVGRVRRGPVSEKRARKLAAEIVVALKCED